jgi:hypothetical protein
MKSRRVTHLSRAFCSARDRNVPVLVRSGGESLGSTSAGSPSDEATELVSCLDYGVRCTGWLCPLFPVPALPPEDVLEEAARAERDQNPGSVADGRAILERARREGQELRREETRRQARSRRLDPGGVLREPPAGH